ncbi:hypothetical protein GCM10022255_109250 [Dactylosporangium darangshiense]|uniref:Uncharacterized protein n=3 Tax=Dactylosporangium darangshiense TaxID=579108 RepID=A0ABP8DUC0_9ACTN
MRNLHDLLADEADRRRPAAIPPFEALISRSARRRTRRSAGIALAAVAAVIAVLAATAPLRGHTADPAVSRSPAALDGPTTVFAGGAITFRHPVSWRPQQFPAQSTAAFFVVITYLSTDQLHDTCSTPAAGEVVCAGMPLAALSPGGVLITWTRRSAPGDHRLSDQAGRQTTLDGHPASINATSATDECAAVGATREVHAIIVLDPVMPYQHWLDMSACLAAPDAARAEMQVNEMLASLRVTSGP